MVKNNNSRPSDWSRMILHADMDAFFAAVEQRDDPALKGRPVIVGGHHQRGVVSTASYEARKFGVHSAMPMVEALRRCPQAVVLPPDFARYQKASSQIMAVFGNYSPIIEPLSLDEAFLDMTGAEGLFGPPRQMARQIKQDVMAATGGLTISVGISVTKYVAKVASDYQKPDGLTVVSAGEVSAFLHPQSISHIWGVGPKSRKKLAKMGFETIGDVARAAKPDLIAHLGSSLGEHIWQLANGIDEREVIAERGVKSIGKEITLEEDVVGRSALLPHLKRNAAGVARRLRKQQRVARAVRVKLKTADFRLLTRQAALTSPTDSAKELMGVALQLLDQFDLRQPMRLVGLAAFNLSKPDEPVQQELFVDRAKERNRRLDRTLDEIQARFGDVIKRS